MSDLIKKRDAIETLNAVDVYGDGIGFEVLSHAIRDVSLLPTVEAEPVRHGHWIMEFENDDGRDLRCSECRMKFYVGKGRDGNYCPNCGAKMDEVKEE